MKKWNRTILEWNCHLGLPTNIPVTDWCRPKEKHFHTIHQLDIEALPEERMVAIKLHIRRVSVSPTTELGTIMSRLFLLKLPKPIQVQQKAFLSCSFIVTFPLEKKMQFCDTAIGAALEVLDSFGIKRDSHRIAEFRIFQETLVRIKGEWLPFEVYLAQKHGLRWFPGFEKRDNLSLVQIKT